MNAAIQGQAPSVESVLPVHSVLQDDQVLDANSMVMNDPSLKENNPVTWDRLSMTVSSMVAWSMQVEMSDDQIADELTESDQADMLEQDGATLAESVVFEAEPQDVSTAHEQADVGSLVDVTKGAEVTSGVCRMPISMPSNPQSKGRTIGLTRRPRWMLPLPVLQKQYHSIGQEINKMSSASGVQQTGSTTESVTVPENTQYLEVEVKLETPDQSNDYMANHSR